MCFFLNGSWRVSSCSCDCRLLPASQERLGPDGEAHTTTADGLGPLGTRRLPRFDHHMLLGGAPRETDALDGPTKFLISINVSQVTLVVIWIKYRVSTRVRDSIDLDQLLFKFRLICMLLFSNIRAVINGHCCMPDNFTRTESAVTQKFSKQVIS